MTPDEYNREQKRVGEYNRIKISFDSWTRIAQSVTEGHQFRVTYVTRDGQDKFLTENDLDGQIKGFILSAIDAKRDKYNKELEAL